MILRLIDRVHRGTIEIAQMLAQAEQGLNASPDENKTPDRLAPSPPRDRTARLLQNAWRACVRPRLRRRPDPLALTCDSLANPDVPLTRDALRYALVLALRMVYGIEHTTDSIAQLRESHSELSRRFLLQTRRRQKKAYDHFESFIIDIACMEGLAFRSLTPEHLRHYYAAFEKQPFGITQGRREFGQAKDWPELFGTLPDFSTLVRLAFAQPTAVTGLDRIMLGMLGAASDSDGNSAQGGLVTLIGGKPGTGKTTLALTLAARMAEFGSVVSYVATEEAPHALGSKLHSVVQSDFLSEALGLSHRSESERGRRDINPIFVDGRGIFDLEQLVKTIVNEMERAKRSSAEGRVVPFLAFPRVLVIDSITALVHRTNEASAQLGRQRLAELLSRLRDLGLCVFLTGGPHDCADEGLAYLVDNVFSLDNETRAGSNHPLRIFDVNKTRQQASYRGRHVFHLSPTEGFVINPSLHSVSRVLHAQPQAIKTDRRALLWSTNKHDVTIRSPSHILVFGHGSTGKARLALLVAHTKKYTAQDEAAPLERTGRVLVISFLYEESYYVAIANQLRTGLGGDDHLKVIFLYPGYLDPETLVAQITRAMRKARLEGRPYTSAVIDGIHNLLLQFPLLQNEALLWPTLFRLFRVEGIDAVSTYTFFEIPSARTQISQPPPTNAHAAFFHLLVCSCDYSISVERDIRDSALARLHLVSGLSHGERQAAPAVWNPAALSITNPSAEDVIW